MSGHKFISCVPYVPSLEFQGLPEAFGYNYTSLYDRTTASIFCKNVVEAHGVKDPKQRIELFNDCMERALSPKDTTSRD